MNQWSLSKKIWSIIGGLAFAFVFSTMFSLHSLIGIRGDMHEVTSVIVKRDQLSSEIRDNQRRFLNLTAEAIIFMQPERLKRNAADFEEVLKKQEADSAAYNAIASPEGKQLYQAYTDEFAKFLSEMRKARELGIQNKTTEASEVYIQARESIVPTLRKIVNQINELTTKTLEERSASANSAAGRAIWMSLAIASVSILLSLLVAFFVLRALTGAISQIVKGLSDSSAQVTSAATQIASASEQLSQATTEQAASLEETAASVEEMNSMVAKNSENASSAASTSTKSQEAVTQGKQVVQKMMAAMEAINSSSEGMNETVKVIEQIDKKTKVINEIVNKTELLSFNASVEAARAGEHGKGFAVVAEEVGNLARMSGAAAEEIASLLEESISKVNQMVADTRKNVEMGSQVTRECGEVFEEVVKNVNSVSGMATEIASASQEQSRGCTEITKAMSQLDQMTQQNAATSEECASAAEELSAQAEALKGAVTNLVFTVNGSSGRPHVAETHSAPSAPVRKSAPTKPSGGNVVRLKTTKSGEPALKKASGDVPHYDSEGFTDV